jgi:diaminohydroxyphosphoribosylaminopyrimidine deaminase/5-amino-6-(5-phosphoribosylamino)uracil reductase
MANHHEVFMARAMQLAERGLFTTDPNPRVGCVIVKNGTIIGEGWHQRAGEPHAEVHALRAAGEHAKDADCYVTLEPCSHFGLTPPCADGLIKAQVKRVFVAMRDPNPLVAGNGIEKLRQAGIEVTVGLLAAEAEALNPGFCKRMRQARPYVRSKIAMSFDGRTSMASGESKWITAADARLDVQKLRARSSAILTGIGTVLTDDPSLNVRLTEDADWYHPQQAIRQPMRVIVDSRLQTPVNAKMFNMSGDIIIATADAEKAHPAAQTLVLNNDGVVDLTALMNELAKRQVNEVMVEAGPRLNGALLQAGLIDELIIYMAPKLMGDQANGLFHLPFLQTMAQCIDLQISDIRPVGKDWRITAKPLLKES